MSAPGRRRYDRHITIASIFPMATEKLGRSYGQDLDSAYSEFQIPACPKGEYRLLTVNDGEEREQDWTQNGEWKTKPVFCEDIGRDLIKQWTSGFMHQGDGFGPGIMVIAGDEPTEAELMEMKTLQTRWAEVNFYAANELAAKEEHNQITPLMRELTRWIGKNADWVTELKPDEIIDCPLCTEKIKSSAYICPKCTRQIRALPKKFADMEGSTEAVAAVHPLPPPINAPKQAARV